MPLHRFYSLPLWIMLLMTSVSHVIAADEKPVKPIDIVDQRINAIFDQVQSTGHFNQAYNQTGMLFDQVIAYLPPEKNVEAYADAAYAHRLMRLLALSDNPNRQAMLEWLRKHKDLARTLAFCFDARGDNATNALDLLQRLIDTHGEEQVTRYHQLAAAIVLVHDLPEGESFSRRINENRPESDDPVKLFDYYVTYGKHMNFGVEKMPTELLIYVVDTTASINEMQWALKKYRGDRAVGRRFFDIRYDYDHLRGKPKEVTVNGFNLQNIRAHGGVCADQAYFAMTVGKSIGVPTVYTVASSADSAHAWVGYLQSRGRQVWWNFNEGRYNDYQQVRGLVINPQTMQTISDSKVSLLAEMFGSTMTQRQQAAALTDAAMRVAYLREQPNPDWPPKPLIETTTDESADDAASAKPKFQPLDVATQFALVSAAQKQFIGHADAWLLAAHMGREGELSLDQKRRYADYAVREFGRNYPDFMVLVASGLISGIENPAEQSKVWDKLFAIVKANRKDLAAEIRTRQAKLWEEAGDFRKAGICYHNIVENFANDGPFAVEAAGKVEEMLISLGKDDKVLQLYRDTWNRIKRPKFHAGFASHFYRSNWYRIGSTYADLLEQAGNTRQAERVREKLEAAAK